MMRTNSRFSFLVALLTAGCGDGVSLDPGSDGGRPGGDAATGGDARIISAGPCGQLGSGGVRTVDYLPDGSAVVVGYGSGSVRIYAASSGNQLAAMKGHSTSISAMALSPDGTQVATGARDGTLKVWRVTDGAELLSVQPHMSDVTAVAFSPDGTLLATGGMDATVKLLQRSDGSLVRDIAEKASVGSVFFVPDGTQVVTQPYSAIVSFRRVSDGALVHQIGNPDNARFSGLSADGSKLLGYTDHSGHEVGIWRASDGGREWLTAGAHTANIMRVVMSPDGATVASASWDGTAGIWRGASGAAVRKLTHADPVNGVALSPDGATVVTGTTGGEVRVWRTADGSGVSSAPVLPGHSGSIFQVSYSADGSLLASSALDGGDTSVKVWRTKDGALLHSFPDTADQSTQSMAFSPDGSLLATGSRDGKLHLWQMSDGKEFLAVTPPSGAVSGVAFSPDGMTVGTGCRCTNSAFRAVRRWRLDGTEELGSGNFGEGALGFAFSADGMRVAIVTRGISSPGSLQIWPVGDLSPLWKTEFGEPTGPAGASVTFSPDGTNVAASMLFGKTTKVYRASDGALVRDITDAMLSTDALSFSRDGALLAGATDMGVKIWRTSDWTLAGSLGAGFTGTAFSPVEDRLAAGGRGSVVHQWCDLKL